MGVALLHHPFEILEIRIVPSISVYILSIPIPIWVAPGLWKPPSSTVVFPWFSSTGLVMPGPLSRSVSEPRQVLRDFSHGSQGDGSLPAPGREMLVYL